MQNSNEHVDKQQNIVIIAVIRLDYCWIHTGSIVLNDTVDTVWHLLHKDVGDSGVGYDLHPLYGRKVRQTCLVFDEVLVVHGNLEIVWLAQDNHLELLSSLKRETWLSSLLCTPSAANAAVPDNNSIVDAWIEVEGNVTALVLSSEINGKLCRSRCCSDVDQTTWEQTARDELLHGR